MLQSWSTGCQAVLACHAMPCHAMLCTRGSIASVCWMSYYAMTCQRCCVVLCMLQMRFLNLNTRCNTSFTCCMAHYAMPCLPCYAVHVTEQVHKLEWKVLHTFCMLDACCSRLLLTSTSSCCFPSAILSSSAICSSCSSIVCRAKPSFE